MTAGHVPTIAVPIARTGSTDETIRWAIDTLLADRCSETATLHLVFIETPGDESSNDAAVTALIDRSESIARQHAPGAVTISTAHLAADRYLDNPHAHAEILAEYVRRNDIDLVALDPNYSVDATNPRLQPVRRALSVAGVPFQVAPVRADRRIHRDELGRLVGIAGMVFGFYVVVAAPTTVRAVGLGGIIALLVGGLFRNVAFESTPRPRNVILTVGRGLVFVPYLLWRIITANFQISYLVLHPKLPIDPHVDSIDTALGDGLSVTAFANSLTLTPGTVAVDAASNTVVVHSITPATRLEVLDGTRERAVGYVFYGRSALEAPSPLEREAVHRVAGRDPTSGGRRDE